jgi:predicted dienelactone hydrolase
MEIRRAVRTAVALWTVCGAALGAIPADPLARHYRSTGPYEVATASDKWRDETRQRDIPLIMYFPKTGQGPFPLIVFSHGLGASHKNYDFLGRQWASHGYVSVHIGHEGSNAETFARSTYPKWAVLKALTPGTATGRALDVKFAIDQMERIAREPGPLQGRVDVKRVGVSGHSYGAFTTLGIAGQVYIDPLGLARPSPDPRVRAVLPLSAPVINRSTATLVRAYGRIAIPMLLMTGTNDAGDTPAWARRLPFDYVHGADKYLVTFKGGDHLTFVGWVRPGAMAPFDRKFHELIRMSTTAFWDAYLKDKPNAKEWLAGRGFEAVLDGHGKYEKSLKASEVVQVGN